MKRGFVSVNLTVARDGKPQGVRVTSTSGFSDLDSAAVNAVSEVKQFPPFPDILKPEKLELRINFYYNPDKPIKEGAH